MCASSGASMDLSTALGARVASLDALQVLYNTLESGVDAPTACDVLETISSWLRRSADRSAQRMMAEQRRHQVLVAAMRLHGHNIEFARLCCSAIGGASYRCAENVGPLCRAGVVAEVGRVMELHGNDSVVMDLGCEALWRIGERGGGSFIQKTGGVEWLLRALRMHRDNPFLQSNACSALYPLVDCGSPWLDQMRAEAQVAIATHVGHKPIYRAAEKLIKACDEAANIGDSDTLTNGQVTSNVDKDSECLSSRMDLRDAAANYNSQGSMEPNCAMDGNMDSRMNCHEMSLKEWLNAVDDEGHLMKYLASICERFSTLSEVVQTYRCDGGHVDPRLFEDFGIKRLGHRRLFEVWFRDHSVSCVA